MRDRRPTPAEQIRNPIKEDAMKPCPLCNEPGIRILMGSFSVWLCENEGCSAVWGFWSRLACWLTPVLYPPSDDGEGFAFVAYTGSYRKALWGLMTR